MTRHITEKLAEGHLSIALRSQTGGAVGDIFNLALCRLAEQKESAEDADLSAEQKQVACAASQNELVDHMEDIVCAFLGPDFHVMQFTIKERPPICIDEDDCD